MMRCGGINMATVYEAFRAAFLKPFTSRTTSEYIRFSIRPTLFTDRQQEEGYYCLLLNPEPVQASELLGWKRCTPNPHLSLPFGVTITLFLTH